MGKAGASVLRTGRETLDGFPGELEQLPSEEQRAIGCLRGRRHGSYPILVDDQRR